MIASSPNFVLIWRIVSSMFFLSFVSFPTFSDWDADSALADVGTFCFVFFMIVIIKLEHSLCLLPAAKKRGWQSVSLQASFPPAKGLLCILFRTSENGLSLQFSP